MKEKTFEELIEESFYDKDRPFMYFYKEDIIPLLQQVREATKAECVEILRNPNIPKTRMEALPTDRIKIEE